MLDLFGQGLRVLTLGKGRHDIADTGLGQNAAAESDIQGFSLPDIQGFSFWNQVEEMASLAVQYVCQDLAGGIIRVGKTGKTKGNHQRP